MRNHCLAGTRSATACAGRPLLTQVGDGVQHLLETRLIPKFRQTRIASQPFFAGIPHPYRTVHPIHRAGNVTCHGLELGRLQGAKNMRSGIGQKPAIHFLQRLRFFAFPRQQ